MRLLIFLALFTLVIALQPGISQASQRAVNNGQLVLHDVPEIPAALVTRLRQYQNVRSAALLDWDKNGKSLYVRTRFGAVSQMHQVFGPGGARHQLTWLENPIGQVERRPGSRELAFTMDQDGGEFDQFTGATITPRAIVSAVHDTLLNNYPPAQPVSD